LKESFRIKLVSGGKPFAGSLHQVKEQSKRNRSLKVTGRNKPLDDLSNLMTNAVGAIKGVGEKTAAKKPAAKKKTSTKKKA